MIEIISQAVFSRERNGRFSQARKEVADALEKLPHDKTIKVPVVELTSATVTTNQHKAIRGGLKKLTAHKFRMSIRDGFVYFGHKNGDSV